MRGRAVHAEHTQRNFQGIEPESELVQAAGEPPIDRNSAVQAVQLKAQGLERAGQAPAEGERACGAGHARA